jgi:hypothetical protein
MPDSQIVPRDGIKPAELDHATYWYPLRAPDLWLTRDETAAQIGVNPRTVDRYVRDRRLTVYTGPVPGSLRGVRILKSEVDNWVTLDVKAAE